MNEQELTDYENLANKRIEKGMGDGADKTILHLISYCRELREDYELAMKTVKAAWAERLNQPIKDEVRFLAWDQIPTVDDITRGQEIQAMLNQQEAGAND